MQKLLGSSLLVLLIAIPLYPKFPLASISGTWVAIRVFDILVAGITGLWFVNQAIKKFPVFKQKIFKLFLLYWGITLVINIFAFFAGSVSLKLMLFHWIRRIEYMVLFFVAYNALPSKKNIKHVLGAIGIALTGVLLFAWGQKYYGLPVISTMNEEFAKGALLYLDKWTRISSTFAGHYDLAIWVSMILVSLPVLFLISEKVWQKLLVIIAFGVSFHLLTLTASRVSFVAYLFGISLCVVLIKKYLYLPIILGISLIWGLSSKELNARLASTFPQIKIVQDKSEMAMVGLQKNVKKIKDLKIFKKLEPTPKSTTKPEPTIKPIITESEKPTKFKPTKVEKKTEKIIKTRTWPTPEEAGAAAARSSNIRFQVEWPRAIRAFTKNPLVGTGQSSLGLATDSDYLRLLGETGLVGFLSFFLIIFYLLNNFLVSKHPLSLGFFAITITFLANAVLIDAFEASKVASYFWLLTGIGYKLTEEK